MNEAAGKARSLLADDLATVGAGPGSTGYAVVSLADVLSGSAGSDTGADGLLPGTGGGLGGAGYDLVPTDPGPGPAPVVPADPASVPGVVLPYTGPVEETTAATVQPVTYEQAEQLTLFGSLLSVSGAFLLAGLATAALLVGRGRHG